MMVTLARTPLCTKDIFIVSTLPVPYLNKCFLILMSSVCLG